MEKGPNFNVVGKVSEKQKDMVKNRMNGLLFENHLAGMGNDERMELEENELPKTAEEIEFIKLANDETNMLMKQAGIDSYDVPERNFHKINLNLYKKYKPNSSTSTASFDARNQMILINAEVISKEDRVTQALAIFHDLLHMKSYLAQHVSIKEMDNDSYMLLLSDYREGVDVKHVPIEGVSDSNHEHFFGLNEAIVSYEEKKYLHKILQLSQFSKELEILSSPKILSAKKYLTEEHGIPEDDIIAIDFEGNDYTAVGYSSQREVLEFICQEIAKDNNGMIPDDVHDEFLKSQLTGRLLKLAHLVESSFGKGSFRELGKMTSKKETAKLVLEAFKALRLKKKNTSEGV